ncbi:MAG: putative alcohol dehydrogenase, zinc-containing [Osedax symbiont Rs1]|nr:MAG: putative alcohol dehydrogenase, zinc-containing [Osedax symbiont Rs1]
MPCSAVTNADNLQRNKMKKMKAVGYLESKTIDQHDALLDIQLPIPTATDRDL